MRIDERAELYRKIYKDSPAIDPVVSLMNKTDWVTGDPFEKLEALRELNTDLSDLYQVSIPVITVWVRDDNYVQATGEIYLTEPDLESFLHQFRHHLQNIERKVPHFIFHKPMQFIEMRMKKSGEKDHCRGKRKY